MYPPREKAKRAQLSCFKCRERKVKCDRMKPCSSCAGHQCPEQCDYDMSDDKRIPILTADKLKQISRENIELKAEKEDNKGTIFELTAENQELKARIAVYEGSMILSPIHRAPNTIAAGDGTAMQSHSISMDQRPTISRHNIRSGRAESYPNPDQILSRTNSESFLTDVFQRPLANESAQDYDPLTHAWNQRAMITTQLQYSNHDEQSALSNAAEELVCILHDLPMEYRFTISWSSHGVLITQLPIDVQSFTIYREIHSQIIDVLTRIIERKLQPNQSLSKISIPEAIQNQLATSCLTIIAILEYFSRKRPCALEETDICEQATKAARTIQRLEARSFGISAPIYSQPASMMIQQVASNGYSSYAGSIAALLLDSSPVPAGYNVGYQPRVEHSYHHLMNSNVSVLNAFARQQQQNYVDVVKQETPSQAANEPMSETRLLPHGQHTLDSSNFDGTRGPCFPPTWYRSSISDIPMQQQMSRIVSSTSAYLPSAQRTNSIHIDDKNSFISEPPLCDSQMRSSAVSIVDRTYHNTEESLLALDTNSRFKSSLQRNPGSAEQVKTAPSMVDSSYTPSIFTPSSSLHGSLPVSPVMGQPQVQDYKTGSQQFDCIHEGLETGQAMWNCIGYQG